MHETTIAEVMAGHRHATELNEEALASIERIDPVLERVHVVPADREVPVSPEMLLRLCDAALANAIGPVALRAVAFTIITSDQFTWESDLVAEVLHDWSAPEVNLPLTIENLRRFRGWLAREEQYPERPWGQTLSGGRVLSQTVRVVDGA